MYSTHSGVASGTKETSNTVTASANVLAILIKWTASVVVINVENLLVTSADLALALLPLVHVFVSLYRDPVIPTEIPVPHTTMALCSARKLPLFLPGIPVTTLATLLHPIFVQVSDLDRPQRLTTTHLIHMTWAHTWIQSLNIRRSRAPPDVARFLRLLVLAETRISVTSKTMVATLTKTASDNLLLFVTGHASPDLIGLQNNPSFYSMSQNQYTAISGKSLGNIFGRENYPALTP